MYLNKILFIFIALVSTEVLAENSIDKSLNLKDKLINKLGDYCNDFARNLEVFNDRHLGSGFLGGYYRSLKSKIDRGSIARRRGAKIHSALLPLVFQVGATSTWLILTGLLTVKSVAIGLLLLVFKIAVSSAKVSAFFTAWKQKDHGHHSYVHDDHFRSLKNNDHSYLPDWHTKESHPSVDWHENSYKTIPTHHHGGGHDPFSSYDYRDQRNAASDVVETSTKVDAADNPKYTSKVSIAIYAKNNNSIENARNDTNWHVPMALSDYEIEVNK